MGDGKVASDPLITDGRRCHIQMAAELLEAAVDGTNKSALFRRANLNHTRGTRYLEALVGGGLLQERSGRFELTGTGRRFLHRWHRIQDALAGSAEGSGSGS